MLLPISLSFLALAGASLAAGTCTSKAFKAATPKVFGIEVLDIVADEVKEDSWNPMQAALPPLPVAPSPIDFCNVAVSYTHPGTPSLANK